MNNRPIHFEMQADDLARAIKFYSDVFGWKFEDYSATSNSPYYFIFTGDEGVLGINGGLQPRRGERPRFESGTNGALLTMEVDDYDLFEQKILLAGGQVVFPKTALKGMAWLGYYLDTEGNVIGIHQADENAS